MRLKAEPKPFPSASCSCLAMLRLLSAQSLKSESRSTFVTWFEKQHPYPTRITYINRSYNPRSYKGLHSALARSAGSRVRVIMGTWPPWPNRRRLTCLTPRAFHGLDNAGAHDQNAVAHELNDTTVIADDPGAAGISVRRFLSVASVPGSSICISRLQSTHPLPKWQPVYVA